MNGPSLARLHHDEHPAATVLADEVDLPVARPCIPRDDPHGGSLERASCGGLAQITEEPPRIRHELRGGRGFQAAG